MANKKQLRREAQAAAATEKPKTTKGTKAKAAKKAASDE